MGLLIDFAKEIVNETIFVAGLTTLAGAGAEMAKASERHQEKKAEKITAKFKFWSKLTLYKNSLLGICSEKDGLRTYVFINADNQIKYVTSMFKKSSVIYLHDFNENIIGSVGLGAPAKSGLFGGKKYSRVLSINVGDSQVGTVEIAAAGRTKTLGLKTFFWDFWVDNKEKNISVDKEFKMVPVDKISKTAYQINYNDSGKEVLLALTYIAVHEAKGFLKEV
jgi:hypothetical protein